MHVLAKDGLTHLGGKEFDDQMGSIVLSQFQKALGEVPPLDARTSRQLSRVSEALKIELCMPGQKSVRHVVLLGEQAVEVQIYRREFEQRLMEALEQTESVTRRCLKSTGLSVADVDALLLVAQFYGKRLPTEAEWEKAARGGLVGKKYPWGDNLTHDDANYDGTGGKDIWNGTSPIGSFAPNGYGLHDMAGNVWEWCADWSGNYYSNSPYNNPKGPSSASYRVVRGGSWLNDPDKLLDANLTEVRATSAGITESFTNLGASMTTAQETTQESFNSLNLAIAELQQRVQAFQAETETGFDELGGHITDTQTTEVEAIFSNFSNHLTQNQATEIITGFSNFETDFTHLYSTFNTEAQETANQLMERSTQMLLTTGEYFRDSLENELRQSFEDAVEDVIKAIIQEVIESIALMEIGASVTSALSPILPELAVAKVTVVAINDALDALDDFLPFRF